ncbi:unnamed protein product [Adineta steineri]|uniref:Uncharacterized protein n=1 Tax=Adineta steineri TaxID=433720 RepID=A0A815TQ05_9BILA|nr:unnamed protein product [Adineta steineri]CAF1505970.1 unnamed protein product [Adineta steineri]
MAESNHANHTTDSSTWTLTEIISGASSNNNESEEEQKPTPDYDRDNGGKFMKELEECEDNVIKQNFNMLHYIIFIFRCMNS